MWSVVERDYKRNDYRRIVGDWLGKKSGTHVDFEIFATHELEAEEADCKWLVIRVNLKQDHPEKKKSEPVAAVEFPAILVRVLTYIDDNLQGDLSMASLERRFFINRSYLSRLCRKYLGISLHRYIILRRVAKAKALLMAGKSAMEACQASGFNDYSNFRRMFKKVTNLTPSAYAKKQNRKYKVGQLGE
ncbi:MAG TPA: helix-turn-helix transcriptional regulator [Firmicutes bacterium]|uniref:Helix-turn-helix transcriptional regulator n=1 Tax=Capillibacterium thermochitinicola TaxID=2699427 RepID=A0A8J6LLG8_9FIRM|nr:AraC family transcriptional regulator [Capillibacterium thermochitinicola]MBA2132394.1 helix-turn-helix transcriptional regulator [Capillibacterium thermochitinicola]HHW12135.1 helix-turn-helix transcriptional regulator [Bacillota bacterium]